MIIRKISIGNDLLNAMHFQVGKEALGKTAIINSIERTDSGGFDIWIEQKEEERTDIIKWKTIGATVPVTVEYDIQF